MPEKEGKQESEVEGYWEVRLEPESWGGDRVGKINQNEASEETLLPEEQILKNKTTILKTLRIQNGIKSDCFETVTVSIVTATV